MIEFLSQYWYIVVFVVALAILPNLKNKQAKESTPKIYPYERRPLLSASEFQFFKQIKPIAKEKGLELFSKVRIADIVQVKKGTEKWKTFFNFIQAKHVDFILYDSSTQTVKLVIELDDSTHERKDRRERDNFVDKTMEAAGVPMLHTRNTDAIRERIDQAITPPETLPIT